MNQLHDIRKKININKKFWLHFIKTNCYAYALGLDINENSIMKDAYQPGTLSNVSFAIIKNKLFTYDQLIESIYSDMDKLGIEINPIKWDDNIDEEAWKIALFISYYSKNSTNLYDYHFLRERYDNKWYHKVSYKSYPNNLDDRMNEITNPETCYLKNKIYKGSYSLKIRRNI